MSNFSEVATKFLTVNLHKTAIPKDLIQNFRGLKGPFSTVMLFVVSYVLYRVGFFVRR